MKIKAILATLAATGIMASTAGASTYDICRDIGPGTNRCTASTTETKVIAGSVNLGLFTRGTFVITCHKGNTTTVRRGQLARNASRTFGVGNLIKPTCTLTVQGVAFNGHNAIVRVSLVGG